MSAPAKQTAEDLRKLMDSLGEIYDLSVMHGDLEHVTANLKCAFNLEDGE